MRLFEYESKQIIHRAGLEIPRSRLLRSADFSFDQAESLLPGVVKVQTLSGKRQKRGGVEFVTSEEEVRVFADRFLGENFDGERVERILWEARIDGSQEIFLSISYDPRKKVPVIVLSREGGVEIEQTAASRPEQLHYRHLNPVSPPRIYHLIEWLADLEFAGNPLRRLAATVERMLRTFQDFDALLLEVNPLVQSQSGGWVALDCHLEIDDDAVFRLPDDLRRHADRADGATQLTAMEAKAREIDRLDHRGVAGRVKEFDGNLGLLIGGGGASLTCFDAVRNAGGKPANYCEIGGNPTAHKVSELTKLLLRQPKVEKIAVIMNVVSNTRADIVARGIIEGIVEEGQEPRDRIVMFRLPGAGEKECRELLSGHGVPFYGREVSIDEAARLAVSNS